MHTINLDEFAPPKLTSGAQFITHHNANIDINNTHYVGTVVSTLPKMINTFGMPMDGDGYKVDAEWHIQFADGTVAAIYNWKNGPAYLGPLAELEYVTEWNIGGYDKAVVERIRRLIA